MTGTLVVQNNFVRPLTGPVAHAARDVGMRIHDLSYADDMHGRPALPEGDELDPVLVIGSIAFVNRWARSDASLARWVFWDDARYDALAWAQAMGENYLNHGGSPTTVGEFIASRSSPMHVRPRSGIKMIGDAVRDESNEGRCSLQGAVFSPETLAARNVDPDLPIWISPPTAIDAEIRIWMIAGLPACWSTYRIDGQRRYVTDLDYAREALGTAMSLAALYRPGRHYVIDLAFVRGEWRLVEFNPIHSSGWYGADPAAMLSAYVAAETQ